MVASNQARFVCVWIVQETMMVPDVTIAPHNPTTDPEGLARQLSIS